ncbi:hypothetical protein BM525_19450 (plasmid) [Alteromonas mediterranea]|uniref:Uncharacterized protein n=1 Tax=Alteromonas mediterranea TaxID=314275 RepID=A0AAC9JGF0_9ALTE|nr:hypothetical protein [Alteromonas mediterranea]APD92060.1 hypothetical protein BM524_19255 [Alteromonas mediterranea]APD99914.1 hypothetical protein BM525_19450 [Alteromonas mediterranea]
MQHFVLDYSGVMPPEIMENVVQGCSSLVLRVDSETSATPEHAKSFVLMPRGEQKLPVGEMLNVTYDKNVFVGRLLRDIAQSSARANAPSADDRFTLYVSKLIKKAATVSSPPKIRDIHVAFSRLQTIRTTLSEHITNERQRTCDRACRNRGKRRAELSRHLINNHIVPAYAKLHALIIDMLKQKRIDVVLAQAKDSPPPRFTRARDTVHMMFNHDIILDNGNPNPRGKAREKGSFMCGRKSDGERLVIEEGQVSCSHCIQKALSLLASTKLKVEFPSTST